MKKIKTVNEMSYKEYERYSANKSLSNKQKIMKKMHPLIGLAGKFLKIALIISLFFWFSFTLSNAMLAGQMTEDQVFASMILFTFAFVFIKHVITIAKIKMEDDQ